MSKKEKDDLRKFTKSIGESMSDFALNAIREKKARVENSDWHKKYKKQ